MFGLQVESKCRKCAMSSILTQLTCTVYVLVHEYRVSFETCKKCERIFNNLFPKHTYIYVLAEHKSAVAQVTKCFGNQEKTILTFKLMAKIPGFCFGLLIGRVFRRYFATFRNKNNAFLRCRCFYRLFLIFCLDGFMGRKEGQKLESYISVVVEIILELFIGHSGTILYQ